MQPDQLNKFKSSSNRIMMTTMLSVRIPDVRLTLRDLSLSAFIANISISTPMVSGSLIFAIVLYEHFRALIKVESQSSDVNNGAANSDVTASHMPLKRRGVIGSMKTIGCLTRAESTLTIVTDCSYADNEWSSSSCDCPVTESEHSHFDDTVDMIHLTT